MRRLVVVLLLMVAPLSAQAPSTALTKAREAAARARAVLVKTDEFKAYEAATAVVQELEKAEKKEPAK